MRLPEIKSLLNSCRRSTHQCCLTPWRLQQSSYCPAGASGSTSCPAGYFCPSGSSTYATCPAGKYSAAGSSACSSCAAGRYSAAGASSCTSCARGRFSSGTGNSACTSCPGGKYRPTTGASSCAACPAVRSSALNCIEPCPHSSVTLLSPRCVIKGVPLTSSSPPFFVRCGILSCSGPLLSRRGHDLLLVRCGQVLGRLGQLVHCLCRGTLPGEHGSVQLWGLSWREVPGQRRPVVLRQLPSGAFSSFPKCVRTKCSRLALACWLRSN